MYKIKILKENKLVKAIQELEARVAELEG